MDAQLKTTAAIAALACGAAGALWLARPGSAHAETRPRHGGSLIGSLLSEPATIDPVAARTHAELALVSLVFDTLYRLDDDGQPAPHLAIELPEVSADGLSARVRLYPGVRFHSGRPVAAGDVVASLRRLAASAHAGWVASPIAAVREDAGDVVIELRRQAPDLAELLSSPHASITRAGRAPRFDDADGSGPFRLIARTQSKRRVRLDAWGQHFAGPPFVRQLDLRWFEAPDEEAKEYEAGASDLSFRGAVAFAGHKPKYSTRDVQGPATVLAYVGFCGQRKETRNAHFRRALSLAVGRDAFRNIGTGERIVPATSPAAHDLGGPAIADSDRAAQRDRAKAELARVGGLAKTAFEVLIDRSRPDDRGVAEKIVNSLIKIGLQARIADADARTFARRVGKGSCDLYIGQLAPPAADPVFQLVGAFAVAGNDWAQKELARGTLNLVSAVGAFDNQMPIVPLFHRAVRVHHRDNVYVDGRAFDGMTRLAYASLAVHGKPSP